MADPFVWSRASREEQAAYAEAESRRECAEQGIPWESTPEQSEVVARLMGDAAAPAQDVAS